MARQLCCVCVLCAATPLFLVACGSSGAQPKQADSEPYVAPVDEPGSGTEPGEDDEGGPPQKAAPITTTGPPPPAVPDDYSLTQHDCNNLGNTYEDLLRKEEMTKLDAKKLKPKVHEAARKHVEKVVEDGARSWREMCDGIVGTIQIRSRLKCAMNAESTKRFQGCMDGEFDEKSK